MEIKTEFTKMELANVTFIDRYLWNSMQLYITVFPMVTLLVIHSRNMGWRSCFTLALVQFSMGIDYISGISALKTRFTRRMVLCLVVKFYNTSDFWASSASDDEPFVCSDYFEQGLMPCKDREKLFVHSYKKKSGLIAVQSGLFVVKSELFVVIF